MNRLVDLLKLTTGKLIGIAAIGAVVGLVALNHIAPDLTGFGADTSTNTERDASGKVVKTVEIEQSGKSLWDWLSVLGVPLSLAGLGYWLQQLQQKRVEEEAKEEVLQGYFDRISILLIDKNLIAVATRVQEADTKKEAQEAESPDRLQSHLLPHRTLSAPEDESLRDDKELVNAAVDVIRGRTLSILRRFENDPKRKEDVVRFLAETEIISKCQLDLSGVNLAGVVLSRTNLSKANFTAANFSGAILRGVNLTDVNLTDVNLTAANLTAANLKGTDLYCANLSGVDLIGANLTNANLSYAKLGNAKLNDANLKGANLYGALHWIDGQLSKANLCFTRLPEGSKLDPGRNRAK